MAALRGGLARVIALELPAPLRRVRARVARGRPAPPGPRGLARAHRVQGRLHRSSRDHHLVLAGAGPASGEPPAAPRAVAMLLRWLRVYGCAPSARCFALDCVALLSSMKGAFPLPERTGISLLQEAPVRPFVAARPPRFCALMSTAGGVVGRGDARRGCCSL